jgi:transcriptional regulator NrdR family protein
VSDSLFGCPECGEHLGAPERGRWVDDLQGFRRDRVCPKGHTYPTVERIEPRAFLSKTRIVAAAGTKPYSTDQLQSDLSLKLGPVLGKNTRNLVVARVETRLMQDWRNRRAPKALPGALLSQTVVSVLRDFAEERQLSKQVADALRRSHVLYALSQETIEFPESSQREPVPLSGDGFGALPHILAWLAAWYPRLQDAAAKKVRPHYTGDPREDRWHTLRRDAAPRPRILLRKVIAENHTVLKEQDGEGLQARQDRIERWEPITFSEDTYLRSVSRAFAGRPDFEHLTRYSTQWVYFALAGQDTVRVSDLVAMTTQCLRRVDAVASIRWAIIAKNLTPASLVTEILGMIEWPAPRLIFVSDAAADMRTSTQMQPHH